MIRIFEPGKGKRKIVNTSDSSSRSIRLPGFDIINIMNILYEVTSFVFGVILGVLASWGLISIFRSRK